jgi:hypothetical protein
VVAGRRYGYLSRIIRGNSMKALRIGSMAVIAAAVALAGMAEVKVDQKTQFHLAGALGGIVNVFGGRAAREGITTTEAVRGERKLTVNGSSGELVDLREEKVYHIDYDHKTYRVETFDEIRHKIQEQEERARKNASREDRSTSKGESGPEYVVDFDVRDTGSRDTVNGFSARQVVTTATVHEKGKKIEESGGSILTADMWMSPRIAGMKEIAEFDRRYFSKIYGSSYSGAEMQQLAMLMATNPALGKAMKSFSDKRTSFEGTPVRTTLRFETVVPPGQNASSGQEESGAPSAGRIVGGLMGRIKKSREQKSDQPSSPNRAELFNSTNEILKVYPSVTKNDVSIPSDFTNN